MTRSVLSLLILAVLLLSGSAVAQPAASTDAPDPNVVAQIREEGLERSQIMQTLHVLTDRYGPRLTGSPGLEEAGRWALAQLEEWGLENAEAVPWDWGRPGWTNERLSVHLVEPVQDPLVAEALAWTPGTDGEIVASAVHLVPPEWPTPQELVDYLSAIEDSVTGAIVLVGAPREAGGLGIDRPLRRDDAEVAAEFEPHNHVRARPRGRRSGDSNQLSSWQVQPLVSDFLVTAGAAAQIQPAGLGDGLIRAFGSNRYEPGETLPTIVMRDEDYGRIARLLASGYPVELALDLRNTYYPERRTEYNYTAEIVGSEFPDEVVMLGGHLDGWHAGTGATDNASGVAVMMEAVRILQALDLQPRRTIRTAFWTGEEQGLLGSRAYVAEMFGTAENPTPDFDKFNGYVNVDTGTGRLRGAVVFGPEAAAQVLEDALAPFEDLGMAGARPTSSRRAGGSDYGSFNEAGLPGIDTEQDPIRYFSHTWHTNLDTYEQLLEDDLKQAAVIVASLVYHLADREEPLPRFAPEEMPEAR